METVNCIDLSCWIQFGLAFLSVILSAVALIMTCKVKQSVVSQSYDVKQEELMAKLVSFLNTNLIRLDFVCEYDKTENHPVPSNKVNFFFLGEDKGKTYYDDAPIYITRYTNISWLDEYLYNPFMPKQVAKCLSSFIIQKQSTDDCKELSSLLDKQGITVLQMGIGDLDDETDSLFDPKFKEIKTWIEFKNKACYLKKSIEKWYKKKGIKAKLNMISYVSTIKVDEKGSITKTKHFGI